MGQKRTSSLSYLPQIWNVYQYQSAFCFPFNLQVIIYWKKTPKKQFRDYINQLKTKQVNSSLLPLFLGLIPHSTNTAQCEAQKVTYRNNLKYPQEKAETIAAVYFLFNYYYEHICDI